MKKYLLIGLLIIGLLWANNSSALIQFDAVSTGSNCSFCNSLTIAHTASTTAHTAVFVNIQSGGGGAHAISSVTYGGQTMTKTPSSPHATTGVTANHSVYYLLDAPSGNNNVVLTATDALGNWYATPISYTGVQQFGIDNSASYSTATSSIVNTITTDKNNEWHIWSPVAEGFAVSAGTGTTLRISDTLRGVYWLDNNSNIATAGTTNTLVLTNATNQRMDDISFTISSDAPPTPAVTTCHIRGRGICH